MSVSWPHTLSSSRSRENTQPGCSRKCLSRRNSVGPKGTMLPFLRTLCPTVSIRSEEHTSELQSLMRISYAVFCLKKKKNITINVRYRKQTQSLVDNTRQTKGITTVEMKQL